MTISLILLTFNKFKETTKPCLDSLIQHGINGFELVIVNNLSEDNTRTQLNNYCKKNNLPTPLQPTENLGFSGGMNLGVSASSGDWIVLINSDTIFFENSLVSLKKVLENSSNDIVGMLTNAAGTAQEITKPNSKEELTAIASKIHSNYTGLEIPIYRADFFCVAIRRSCWNELNGLDEIYGKCYYEDLDFSERAKLLGHKVSMTEDVFIAHTGGASFEGNDPSQKKLIAKNKKIYTERFPTSELINNRDDNLKALAFYLAYLKDKIPTLAIELRIQLRLQRALQNTPRSLIKHIKYRLKVSRIIKELSTHGLNI